ncbi:unnamed protein product [Cuscuta europaea]|uniref:Uncharacterized protein n=1 Tax=Cuscuta europaea TaxID=41803 RepID=A0A9P1E3C9_CUSEU|nr:unnamed protein product [Cuscuta europaea]
MSTAVDTHMAQPTSSVQQPIASTGSPAAAQFQAPNRTEQPSNSGVILSPQIAASRLTLPPPPSLGSYSLFNMPEPFSRTPTTLHLAVPQPTAAVSPAPLAPISMPYAGPTFSGQPGLSPFEVPSQSRQSGSTVTLSTNVTNIATTRLDKVEDYLPWRTQFESFLVSHGLLGIVDGSIPALPQLIFDNFTREVPNPEYHSWLRIDQIVRSWIFATLSRNILVEVRTIHFSALIWQRLETRFMAACVAPSIELKRLLTSLKKKEDQSMEDNSIYGQVYIV